jgi:hypothetical protein
MLGGLVKGFPLKNPWTKKINCPQKELWGGGQLISRAAAPREPPTTTIFGNVGINVGVDNISTAFARTICQFLDIAA